LLKYIDGNKIENSFINQLDNKINEIKQDEKERGDYLRGALKPLNFEKLRRKIY
jgi:hypothetical protein